MIYQCGSIREIASERIERSPPIDVYVATNTPLKGALAPSPFNRRQPDLQGAWVKQDLKLENNPVSPWQPKHIVFFPEWLMHESAI